MARYLDIHPDNPQPRLVTQVVEALRDDQLIAYPTDSGYALGAGSATGRDATGSCGSATSTSATTSR